MSGFKVGDQVRVISCKSTGSGCTTSCHNIKIGEILTIKKIDTPPSNQHDIYQHYIHFQESGWSVAPNEIELVNKVKETTVMGEITKKLKELTMTKEQKLLRKYDVVDDCGDLTDEGRKAFIDTLFGDEDFAGILLARLEKLDAEEKKSKKEK